MKRNRGTRSGQSIIELLIAIAIGAVLMVGAAALIAPSLGTNAQANKVEESAELGKELSDNVRAWSDEDWHNILNLATGTANTYFLATGASPFTAVTGTESVALDTTASGTAAYWKLNEGTGTIAYDSSGKNSTGTYNGTTVVLGKIGAGRSFNGSSDYITIPDNSNLDFGSSSFSVSAWVKPTSGNVLQLVVDKGMDDGGVYTSGWILNLENRYNSVQNAIGFGVQSSYSVYVERSTISGTYTAGQWNHIVGVWNASTHLISIYVNGVLSSTGIGQTSGGGEANVTSTNTTAPIHIGTYDNNTLWYQGSIDDVRIYNSVLSASQVSAIYNATLFSRDFYLTDAYRDSSGNATTTTGNCLASAPCYDPSTKLLTVAYSVPGEPTSTITEYLTRNRTAVFSQEDWSAGTSTTSTPLTVPNNMFASSTNITYSTPGQITLSNTGNTSTSSWQNTTSFTPTFGGGGAVSENGYAYVLSNPNADACDFPLESSPAVYYAFVNADGSVSSWIQGPFLPGSYVGAGIAASSSYLYVIGGDDSLDDAGATSSVLYSKISTSTGSMSAWANTTALPYTLDSESAVAYGNYLYVLGGRGWPGGGSTDTSTVLYAQINSNGTLGTWNHATAMSKGFSWFGAAAYNGYMYQVGGYAANQGSTSTVNYVQINTSTGALGSWANTTALPDSAEKETIAVDPNGYIYALGGVIGWPYQLYLSNSSVYYAKVNGGGTLGAWTTGSSLPYAVQTNGAFVTGGRLFSFGGINGPFSNSWSFGSNVTAGDLIVVGVAWDAENAPFTATTTVTDTLGNTYSVANGPQTDSVNGQQEELFYAQNVTGGPDTITANFSAAAASDMTFAEYSGVTTSGALDQNAGAVGYTLNAASGPVTTTQAKELIIGFLSSQMAYDNTFTKEGGWTLRETEDGGGGVILEDKIVTSTAAYNATATLTLGDTGAPASWQASIATFKAQAGGAAFVQGDDSNRASTYGFQGDSCDQTSTVVYTTAQ